MKVYFRRSIKPEETYTVDDFLNEKKVKPLFESVTNEPPFGIPPMAYVTMIYAYYTPETDSYEIRNKHVVLVKSAYKNPKTGEVEQTFKKEYVEGHIRGLFDILRPCDKLFTIEITDGRVFTVEITGEKDVIDGTDFQ